MPGKEWHLFHDGAERQQRGGRQQPSGSPPLYLEDLYVSLSGCHFGSPGQFSRLSPNSKDKRCEGWDRAPYSEWHLPEF